MRTNSKNLGNKDHNSQMLASSVPNNVNNLKNFDNSNNQDASPMNAPIHTDFS